MSDIVVTMFAALHGTHSMANIPFTICWIEIFWISSEEPYVYCLYLHICIYTIPGVFGAYVRIFYATVFQRSMDETCIFNELF